MRSIYRWQGKICRDSEYLLVIKTLEGEYEALEAAIKELHSYELPEILGFTVKRGERRFLDWISGSLDKNADFSDEPDAAISLPDLDELELLREVLSPPAPDRGRRSGPRPPRSRPRSAPARR